MGYAETIADSEVLEESASEYRTEANIVEFRIVESRSIPKSDNTLESQPSPLQDTLAALNEARTSSLESFATTDELFERLDS